MRCDKSQTSFCQWSVLNSLLCTHKTSIPLFVRKYWYWMELTICCTLLCTFMFVLYALYVYVWVFALFTICLYLYLYTTHMAVWWSLHTQSTLSRLTKLKWIVIWAARLDLGVKMKHIKQHKTSERTKYTHTHVLFLTHTDEFLYVWPNGKECELDGGQRRLQWEFDVLRFAYRWLSVMLRLWVGCIKRVHILTGWLELNVCVRVCVFKRWH